MNQLKRGTAFDEDDFETPEDKQLALLGLILGIILFAISIPLVTTGHISYKFTSSEFKTSGTYWHATRIKYKDIVNVKFSKKEIPGTRIDGFNGFKAKMGDFYNFDYKYFKKYTYKKTTHVS
ncbi:MAG: hypothetical protein K6G88_14600 [Lachnospiraceae bacterium]|nr:hypothetical protein [Lachnospiraceae bacterium]